LRELFPNAVKTSPAFFTIGLGEDVQSLHGHAVTLCSVAMTRFTALLSVCAIAFAGIATAQATKTAADGIYTDAQAQRGNDLYQNNCASCHGGALQGEEENPPLSGKHFFTRFGGMPVSALYGFINTQMPLGQAGALGVQGNADVTAYILQVNKFPAGQAELPADLPTLRTITVNKQ
jgi:S-disulfanyl-L-cysteine oxidoreductase SoxD